MLKVDKSRFTSDISGSENPQKIFKKKKSAQCNISTYSVPPEFSGNILHLQILLIVLIEILINILESSDDQSTNRSDVESIASIKSILEIADHSIQEYIPENTTKVDEIGNIHFFF